MAKCLLMHYMMMSFTLLERSHCITNHEGTGIHVAGRTKSLLLLSLAALEYAQTQI